MKLNFAVMEIENGYLIKYEQYISTGSNVPTTMQQVTCHVSDIKSLLIVIEKLCRKDQK